MTGRSVNGRLEVYYYDVMGNVVESKVTNTSGNVDRTYTTYSYSGQPLSVSTGIKGPDGKSFTHVSSSQYDALGRLSASHSSIGLQSVQTASYTYGQAGRLTGATVGSTAVSYGYDQQGRMASIASEPFSMEIKYEDAPSSLSGDITSATWNYAGGASRVMAYAYDSLDRLVSASLDGQPLAAYVYNKHCSPMRITHYGADANNVNFTYDGNKASSTYFLRGGMPMVTSTFGWDANGNLASDTSRGIESISYDRNGHPLKVSLSDETWIAYDYDALGRKLSQTHQKSLAVIIGPFGAPAQRAGAIRPGNEISRTDYVGPCVYHEGQMKSVLIDGGYIDVTDTGYAYRYYIRDHQGSVRAVVDGEGALVEANDYYPYGQPMAAAATASAGAQPYKYGGKELLGMGSDQTVATALAGVYDFGARWHSSLTASFTQPDPKAETYPALSPYAYCAANPIRYTDPTGMTLKLSSEDPGWIDRIIDIYNKALDGYGTVSVNEEGFVNIVKNDTNGSPNEIQDTVFTILNRAINADKEMCLNLVYDTPVLIGDAKSATIDVKDIEDIGADGKWINSTSALMHETTEQYYYTCKGTTIDFAHGNAAGVEGKIVGAQVHPRKRIIDSTDMTIPIFENGTQIDSVPPIGWVKVQHAKGSIINVIHKKNISQTN